MKRITRSEVLALRAVALAGSRMALLAIHAAITLVAVASETPAAPTFSVKGGLFTNTVTVTVSLTTTMAGAMIRHTLDGSEPTLHSAILESPLVLSNSTCVRARVYARGLPPGELALQNYILLDPDVAGFTSDLPIVVVTSFGQEIEKENRIAASLHAVVPGAARSALAGTADFEGRALINLRGRASLRYPKRSYTLKTVDARDDMAKFALLGLPKESDWVLYAPYPDKTLMRDVLAYALSNEVGRWAPRTRYVELFLNESGGRVSQQDYAGVYVLEEKVARGRNRVNISHLEPDDNAEPKLTGGYIFKKDHGEGDVGPMPNGGPAFQTSSAARKFGFPTGPGGFPGDPAGFHPPYSGRSSSSSSSSSSRSSRTVSNGNVTNRLGFLTARQTMMTSQAVIRSDDEDEDQVEMGAEEKHFGYFRTGRTNKFYYVDPEPDELTAVQRAWLKDYVNRTEQALYGTEFRDPVNGYAAFLDVDSFIDYHLLVEVTKNVDGFRFSTFYHKDRGEKIRMGPLWDWNLSFGNCNGKEGYLAEGWLWPQLDDKEYSWFRRLFEDPDFGQRYVDRWSELRAGVFSSSNVLRHIDVSAAGVNEAQARNFERWPILGVTVNPNWFVGDTFAEEVKWMRDWTSNRLDWIERQFVSTPAATPAQAGGVSLSVSRGRILYTLDGSDPRAPGGSVSAKAIEYAAPVALKPGQVLRARTSLDGRWSGPLVRRGP